MGTINLAFHITGPIWAWWALVIMAGILVGTYAIRIFLQCWLHFANRKIVNAAVAAAQSSRCQDMAGVRFGASINNMGRKP